MIPSKPRAAAAAFLIAAAGCGSSSSGGIDTSTPAAYESAIVQVLNQSFKDCYGSIADVYSASSAAATAAQAQAEIAALKATFDPAAAATCISGLQAQGCWAMVLPVPAACHQVFTGTAGAGGVCIGDEECATGLHCSASSSPGACSSGTCAAYALLGQSCASAACTPGTTCNASRVCVAIQLVGAGAACDNNTTVCDRGFYCASGACATLPAQGASCATSHVCAVGLGCAADGTCQPFSKLGASCGGSSQGPCGLPPFSGMDCSASNVCTALVAAQGGSCSASVQCVSGTTCDGTTNTCVPLLGAGAACTANAQCWSRTCSSGACTSPICGP